MIHGKFSVKSKQEMIRPKKIAISQSNYIPWKGYFDLINSVDEFYFLDIVQYTKNDWRNRNLLKTAQGVQWITIPVHQNSLNQKICDTIVAGDHWRIKHWKTIIQSYSKSMFFSEYKDLFEPLYLKDDERFLSKINSRFIQTICSILGIQTKLFWVEPNDTIQDKNERVLWICKDAKARIYRSGPAAKQYLDVDLFNSEGIAIEYMDYTSYPEYTQLFGKFEHGVSILDLIFNEGTDATKYMKSFKQ